MAESRFFYFIAVAGVFLAPSGCLFPSSMVDVGQGPGWVTIIPGVDGRASHVSEIVQGLRAAGFDWTIERVTWGRAPFRALSNLTSLTANRRRAKGIAAKLAHFRKTRPHEPLVLVGFSGGGGLALLSASGLPEDVQLDRVILVAPAISPQFDLTPIQGRCKDKVINFYSPEDQVVGMGTHVFGTIDRKRTKAAGHTGFLNDAGTLLEGDKLMQVRYDPAWREWGHPGGHSGYLSPRWAKEVLASMIRGGKPPAGKETVALSPQ